MGAYKYFIDPFAVDGDKAVIPDPIQSGGSVSYTEGFGFDYQRNLLSDPQALAFPRPEFNQLMNDITVAVQQYQQYGIPNFITTAQNGGIAFPYAKYAMALYDDGTNGLRPYQSLVDNNTSLPTDTTKWTVASFNSGNESVILGNATFEGTVVNTDVVYWDPVNSWYAKALANGTNLGRVIGIANVSQKTVYTYGLVDFATGLTPGTLYYLSNSSAGALTATRPLNYVIGLGVALSATQLMIMPNVDMANVRADFQAIQNTPQSFGVSSTTQVLFGTVNFDLSSSFSSSTFTPQIPGYYQINILVTVTESGSPGDNTILVLLQKNGVSIGEAVRLDTDSLISAHSFELPALVPMNGSTDNIQVFFQNASSTATYISSGSFTTQISGFLVK